MKFIRTKHENTSPPHNCGLPWSLPKGRGIGDPPCPACAATASMTEPKRAEPGNEHAELLKCDSGMVQYWNPSIATGMRAAAAEIERLAALVRKRPLSEYARHLLEVAERFDAQGALSMGDYYKANADEIQRLEEEVERLAARVRELEPSKPDEETKGER